MEQTRDHKRIVITVTKKPHGDGTHAVHEPAKSETGAKPGDTASPDSLAVLASLYRILRG